MREVFQNAAITLLVFLEIMYVRFTNIKNKYEESRLHISGFNWRRSIDRWS